VACEDGVNLTVTILELLKAEAAERKLRSNRFPEHFQMFLILARTSIRKSQTAQGAHPRHQTLLCHHPQPKRTRGYDRFRNKLILLV
jgi:hypothetical protein